MPRWLLVLNESGVPLYSRSYGLPAPAFSFPTMGLLSAVHSSAQSADFQVTRLSSHDAHIAYRSYPSRLIVVLAHSSAHLNSIQMQQQVDQLYAALVSCLGTAKLANPHLQVERTKRHIRSAAWLLNAFLREDDMDTIVSVSLGMPDFVVARESEGQSHSKGNKNSASSVILSGMSDSCKTKLVAIYSHHRLYMATRQWNELDARDLVSIGTLLRTCTSALSRDIPFFLVYSHVQGIEPGKTPLRLITITICTNVQVVMLLGPQPTMEQAVEFAAKIPECAQFASEMSRRDEVSGVPASQSRLPKSLKLDDTVQGLLYIRSSSRVVSWTSSSCYKPTPGDTDVQFASSSPVDETRSLSSLSSPALSSSSSWYSSPSLSCSCPDTCVAYSWSSTCSSCSLPRLHAMICAVQMLSSECDLDNFGTSNVIENPSADNIPIQSEITEMTLESLEHSVSVLTRNGHILALMTTSHSIGTKTDTNRINPIMVFDALDAAFK